MDETLHLLVNDSNTTQTKNQQQHTTNKTQFHPVKTEFIVLHNLRRIFETRNSTTIFLWIFLLASQRISCRVDDFFDKKSSRMLMDFRPSENGRKNHSQVFLSLLQLSAPPPIKTRFLYVEQVSLKKCAFILLKWRHFCLTPGPLFKNCWSSSWKTVHHCWYHFVAHLPPKCFFWDNCGCWISSPLFSNSGAFPLSASSSLMSEFPQTSWRTRQGLGQ